MIEDIWNEKYKSTMISRMGKEFFLDKCASLRMLLASIYKADR